MAKELVHDGKGSWWDGTVTTLCGLKFPGGKGWRDKFFAVSINCPRCIEARRKDRQ